MGTEAAAGGAAPDGAGSGSRDDDIAVILRAIVAVAKRTRSELRDLHPDIGYVDYTLLYVLGENPDLRAVDLAEIVAIDKSTASRQLAGLERRGLLRREPDPDRPRSRRLLLTDQARAILVTADERWRSRVASRTRDWTAADLHSFAQLIDRYMAADGPS
ncbi:MarR family transcriptional regulator [Tsukamurella sp. 8F]|uniref:MarR family winged helix-turn-helix transcriptional regulator n=1 Tax=unclassified Tsukamurella TaxID=2633480 RepID=UPI0023B9D329|nr:MULTISPECIES: MarR family transcriptional regulator [unclassified Tsukamurella]MDF0531515.1 MarR family transcriptional regulator [Tsukamurella sp. 8J]MDF0588759.1 MarR family transcriptional regulator [Tsukamurella sp. 8F]